MLLNAAVLILSFASMEWVAWSTHKYVMHGFLWSLHKDHHDKSHSPFELNDLFGVFFALVSITCMAWGYQQMDWPFFLGLGIALYGGVYFFVHDMFVHGRIKVLRSTKNKYLVALRRAHRMHHRHLGKDHGEEFGFLIVSPKYFRPRT